VGCLKWDKRQAHAFACSKSALCAVLALFKQIQLELALVFFAFFWIIPSALIKT
jgi:hypothetical protein